MDSALAVPQTLSAIMEKDQPLALPGGATQILFPFVERMTQILQTFWGRREWLLVLIPYLFAWWIPATWCASFWFDPLSPVSFQPLVPLAAFLLVWSRRVELGQIWTELRLMYSEENSRRRGHMGWAIIGCLMLLFAHLAHLPAVGVAGLILMAIGIVRKFFGSVVVRALAIPFFLLALMIPPPETLITLLGRVMSYGSTQAVGGILNAMGKGILIGATTLPLNGYTLEVGFGEGGAAIVTSGLFLSLWLAFLVRANLIGTFVLIVSSFSISILLNLARLLAMAVVGTQNADLANALGHINPWVFTAISFLLTFLIGRATRFGQRTR